MVLVDPAGHLLRLLPRGAMLRVDSGGREDASGPFFRKSQQPLEGVHPHGGGHDHIQSLGEPAVQVRFGQLVQVTVRVDHSPCLSFRGRKRASGFSSSRQTAKQPTVLGSI